jgi:hypothetical protein
MILSSSPTNEAVLSNVGAVSAFTIKATAKSFSILSSGLYANKIRAIIRELSCNALDSHVAAGNTSTPFVIHLPNSIEPHFSVRDFGTGLSNDQVVNIFTSFFTSTKTDSNDFIGALGLGSKSPFSYTDNFTVTTVKDGQLGIYSAFIDETGVPSIAMMLSEKTDEPNGVEIKFAVNERYDFSRFHDEARQVFMFWKNRPTVTGNSNFAFQEPEYKDRDIVPGVHTIETSRYSSSVAIMGNIAYPIAVPDADTVIGEYRNMLSCGLVLEFGIGELDFQASREGLSYIPLTINSIRAKLEALNSQLSNHLAIEADKIENLWERCDYLVQRTSEDLWKSAVAKYVADTEFPLIDPAKSSWDSLHKWHFAESYLASEFNMVIRSFTKNRGQTACQVKKPSHARDPVNVHTSVGFEWQIRPETSCYFVFNDTKVSAAERAKNHWRNAVGNSQRVYTETVYVIEPAVRTLPIKQTEFLTAIMNPPENRVLMASALLLKDRASSMGKNVSILRLEERSRGYSYNAKMVWADAGKVDTFDSTATYYYLPLNGFTSLGMMSDVKMLSSLVKRSGIYKGTIYGVRKSDAEFIKTQANWVNLDTMITTKLASLSTDDCMGMVKNAIGFKNIFHWNIVDAISSTSPYVTLFETFANVSSTDDDIRSALKTLCAEYKIATAAVDTTALIEHYETEVDKMNKRYPLLTAISRYSAEDSDVAEYINMIDQREANSVQFS